MDKWTDGRWREPLPIDGYLPEILSALRQNQVLVVEAETGAGKTTRIPQALLLEDKGVHVWMTQTRRPAVRWNGKRIAWEMGEAPGGIVGWRLRGEDPMVSNRTRLTLVIDQTLVNQIRREGRLSRGILVIDEAHERSVSTDLLLGLIKQYLPSSPGTRLVVTSATIDTRKFSEYFDGAPVVSVPGRVHPVEIQVHQMAYAEHHSAEAAKAAGKVMEQFAKSELTIADPRGNGDRLKVTAGSVLVLLPGKEDIAQAMTSLAATAEALGIEGRRVQALACHGEVSGQEQDAVQTKVPEGTIRFVCATEIVRSSVTVPQTIGVIDSLQVKRLLTDAKGVAHLTKVAVSKAEADQAKGRAGRTQPGFYIPVSYGNEFDRLAPWPVPAIIREPITSVVLQVAAVGLDVRTFPFIDRPDTDKITVATGRLKKLGALDEKESITELGELLVQFPVDPERARSLVTADELGVLAETIIVSAVIENEGIFHRPKERESKVTVEEDILRRILAEAEDSRYFGSEYRQPKPEEVDLTNLPDWVAKQEGGKYEVDCGDYEFPHREGARWIADQIWAEFAAGTGSDFVAAVMAFRAFKAKEWELRDLAREARKNGEGENGEGSRRWVDDNLRQWSFANFLNLKRLRLVEDTIRQLREEVENSPLTLHNRIYEEREFSAEALTKSLASGHVDFVHRHTSDRYFDGPMGEGIQLSYSSACPAGSQLILVGGVRKIPMRGRRGSTYHIQLADMAAPIEAAWLTEVMPQLCTASLRSGSAKYDSTTGTVKGVKDTYYGNVLIKAEEVQVTDGVGVRTFSQALTAGQVGHPCVTHNKAVRAEVEDLNRRSGSQLGTINSDDLVVWYELRLGDVCTLADAESLDLNLTDSDVSELLGKDYAVERTRLRAERPDNWNIAGEDYALTYEWSWSLKGVKISLPVAVIAGLSADQLPKWGGMAVRVVVADEGYTDLYVTLPDQSLDGLRQNVEARRLELAWRQFEVEGHGDYDRKVEIPYQAPMPELPMAEVWDPQTNGLAYPAWVYSTYSSGMDAKTVWYQRWFQTEDQARKARAEAEAKKAEREAAEFERRNFDALKAQAQTLYSEVELLWQQINTDQYLAYGLSYEETRDYGSAEISLPKRLNEAKTLAGLGYYETQPAKAIAALTSLKGRLDEALTRYAENQKLEPEAQKALESVRTLFKQIQGFYESDELGYSERGEVVTAFNEAEKAFNSGDYVKAIEMASEVLEIAKPLIARVQAKRQTREILDNLLAQEYATCPICGRELDFKYESSHFCGWDFQDAFRSQGQDQDFLVKVSCLGEAELVKLVAEYDERDEMYELRLEVNQEVLVDNPEAIGTRTLWRSPSPAELELVRQLRELESRLEYIDRELKDCEGDFPSRVCVKFELDSQRGTLFAIADVGELSVMDNKSQQYVTVRGTIRCVCDPKRCGWLEGPPPASGETWVCSWGRAGMISRDKKGRLIIVVNPQTRVDSEERQKIEAEIEKIKAEIEALRAGEEPAAEEPGAESAPEQSEGDNREITPDMLQALKAWAGSSSTKS